MCYKRESHASIYIFQEEVQREYEEETKALSESLGKQLEESKEELTAISTKLSERDIELQTMKEKLVSWNDFL